MGANVWNLSTQCDYATPEKVTTVELHMSLHMPYNDLARMQEWLGSGDWDAATQYLSERHPRHRVLLAHWMSSSQQRSERRTVPELATAA
ncbi:hypothetical protein [Chitinasiproducens palmae]|uniref:Uncharacterized protein n=1 Tax=Chitinasiproducens palmae TaxID=1770053 RepID=A0A1H2PMH0_9BURK|nr:hypothetical protein [Chitinasiproducens palmae]SDV47793.1 hypothetical protein SAMN05216551_103301 [Chitinasiproducens palmae]